MRMNTLIDITKLNVQENPVQLQKDARHNILKMFECPQCGLTFDRPSQMGYHYRSLHLGEKSQVCQICEKGFFRKADLRTHLNTHLGTNVCICEVCGRKFNHISNLIRHCKMHAGLKPYLCSICDKRFTQVSSLVRHKQVIHGIPKETMRQYCSPSLNNKSQANNHALKENEVTDNNVENKCHEIIHVEQKCQNIGNKLDLQKDKIISNQDNTVDTDNKVTTTPLETIVFVTSKQCEEGDLTEIENINRLPHYLAEFEEKLESTDLLMNKTVPSNPPQDIANNYEQIQFKDNIIYLHQLGKNSFTFLPRDRGPNAESQTQNDENILRSSDLDTCSIQNFKEASTNDAERSLSMETNLQTCDSGEISTDQKFLHKQVCKEIVGENNKNDKSLNDDNQLYLELSELGLLKFDESRYCNNTDSISGNPSHATKSQDFASSTADDLMYIPVNAQEQDNLTHNIENVENLNNSSNVALNSEEPMLRLVQAETGEQFYELIINDLVEKMQNVSCAKNLENEAEESSSNAFRHCQSMALNSRESNEKNSTRTDHQQTLEDLTDINNEFNYTQFDFHRAEKNFAVSPCHDESDEHFRQSLTGAECTNCMQEKNMQTYNSGSNLELLGNESHVTDFDVETNLEVFERLNYENCSEKFLEFVEVADIESLGYNKESSMVCLIQNDGEQLLELLQDSQISGQEPNRDFVPTDNLDSKDRTEALQDGNKIVDYSEGKSDFFTSYVESNVPLEESVNSDRGVTENNEQRSGNNSYADLMANKNEANGESCAEILEELRKLRAKKRKTKVQCLVCRKAFSTAYNFKQHIGIHFTDQQRFRCEQCGASFAWKSTLNKHIANNHSSDGPQKFVCDICPRVYSTLSQVNEHVKRDHLKQRNHVCPHCGKSFFKRFDLKIHSRTHTNERPYMCRVCGKRFHHQSHIIRHERVHSGERPYVCDVCEKTFTQLSSLKAHRQKHQQIKIDILDYQIDEDDPVVSTIS